jgi:fructose-1,6-bisphosphatase/inositol monophosphatase family enzyme
VDIEDIATSIEHVLVTTLERIPALHDLHVRLDADGEPTSIVDTAVEAGLAELLGAIRPQAGFLGEEAFRAGHQTLSAYTAYDELWIVDPIDGTGNFLAGRDDYGTLVAYAKSGVTTAAWIVLPTKGIICCAELGAGVRMNRKQHRLSNAESSPASGILATGDFDAAEYARAEQLRSRLRDSRGTRSCAVDYVELVRGIFDIALYKRTRPWDHAAGVLVHAEAGGCHANFWGKQYDVFDHRQGLVD